MIAILGIVAAGAFRIVFSEIGFDSTLRDTVGLFLVGIAAIAAWGRLR